ncbi:MAG: serine hydrolase domain-containing protein [Pseudomonadota bacterium]
MLHRIFPLLTVAILSACGGGGANAPAEHPQEQHAVPLRDAIDAIIVPYMSSNGMSAATISILKDGVPLYEHGYGFQNAAHSVALPANALFRTASLIKPVTAAAIQKLAAQGKLSMSDHAFCVGNKQPCWLPATLLSATTDARAKDITVGQLIEHKGGWDTTISGNIDTMEATIRDALGKSGPPNRDEIVRFGMARPLDFTPGARSAYSTFGYMLLGQIVEAVTKTSYLQYAQENIMGPLGISAADFKQAHSLLAERDAREPNYLSTLMWPSAFNPGKSALAMDEGALMENWTAGAGTLASAHAMALFAANYRLPDGVPLAGSHNDGAKNGDVPGASTVMRQLPSGVSYALFINANGSFSDEQGPFLKQIDAAIAASLK